MILSRIAASIVGLYVLALAASARLSWHHVGLGILVWALLSRRPGLQRFVREWWPMILFWVAYDGMRLLEPWLLPRVAVRAPYDWERTLFRAPQRGIWPFYFKGLVEGSGASGGVFFLRLLCDFVYLTQLWAVPVLMLAVWKKGHSDLFRRMLVPFAALSLISLALYLIYPAAPPWWVYENGFAQPEIARSLPGEAARAGLFRALFSMSPNRFAAVPSLHGAYPLLLTLVLAAAGASSSAIVLAGVYAAAMWFACVFLNQHYIVDLLLGAVLVPLALKIGDRLRCPRFP